MEIPQALYIAEALLRIVMVCLIAAMAVGGVYWLVCLWESYAIRRALDKVSCSCGQIVIGPRDWPSVSVPVGQMSHGHDACMPLTEVMP